MSTDWSICALCQINSKEPLTCPTEAGYETIAKNIIQFEELDCLPLKIDIANLDNGNGIVSTFTEQHAKWHKSCYLKLSNTKLERAKERKRKSSEDDETTIVRPKRVFTRSTPTTGNTDVLDVPLDNSLCFFCAKGGTKEPLHEASTFQLDDRVRKCAYALQDEDLLAKLSAGDLIALEAKYHARCLANLYNKARSAVPQDPGFSNEETCQGLALAELISYIEERRHDDGVKVFRLADLVQLYTKRLDQFGLDPSRRVNSTHLKDRILIHLTSMRAYKKGRDVYMAYEDDVGTTLRDGYQNDRDEQSVAMTKIANMIRLEIFDQKVEFSGYFDHDSQVESVPRSLLSLVGMIINGSNITHQTYDANLSQPVLSIAQLLMYNCVKRHRNNVKVHQVVHNRDREVPLPVFVGLKVHALTRKRQLVDSLFDLGVSASYDRIMDIVTSLGNNVCDYYQHIGTVCPPQIQKGQFITAATDNIDHNPSSSTSTGSFHGTSLSLFQNSVDNNISSESNSTFTNTITTVKGQRKVMDLPIVYTEVKPTGLPSSDVYVPLYAGNMTSSLDTLKVEMEKEVCWLSHVEELYADDISSESNVSWAAYHANQIEESDTVPSVNAMLPLFSEEANSPSMMRHCFDVIKAAVQYANPGQIPVISVDQPLFAKMKQLQWCMDSLYGEDKFVILLGGLHIEMTSFKMLGQWLEGSGWVEAIQEAKLATSGTAESFLKASHITRTRHAHQVTACVLYLLLRKAYDEYVTTTTYGPPMSFDVWCIQRKAEHPQFMYWYTTLELELLVLAFVRSLRTGNFDLYRDTLTELTPWLFALNHTHYARWMPVHVRDMCNLDSTHPDVAQEFRSGKFVMSKSRRKFSLLAIDQGHEQNNGLMKEDGGIIGLTQDADAILRWAVAGPELVRVISEFEKSMTGKKEGAYQKKHHEQTNSTQKLFATQVKALVTTMGEMGNPFTEESQDLLRLHTKDIMSKESVEFLSNVKIKGQEQYQTFVHERLKSNAKAITAGISRNKVILFNEHFQKPNNACMKINLLKNESSLFARLYIACQTRDGDLDNFFAHENHPFPPSLSSYGHLRLGKKADLMCCLEERVAESTIYARPDADVMIMDGAVLVNILRPGACKTFDEYATKLFVPYVNREQNHVQRADIVWDRYFDNSLKSQTREKRAAGPSQRRRVEGSSPIPKNWQQFLRLNSNKIELFEFLTATLVDCASADHPLVLTDGPNVQCVPPRDTSRIAPCNHEEADSRIMVHVADAAAEGFRKIMVRTVDTDVAVLAVAAVQQLGEIELWIAFGTGKEFRYIPAHEICESLGPQKSMALPVFHAFTGCDTVSQFAQVGKKTAWKVWETHDEITSTFYDLHNAPDQVSSDAEAALGYFTILLYDRTSTCNSIDTVRKLLFTRKGRQMSALPPTKAALQQHIRRAVLQGGHHWGNCTMACRQLPCPAEWGWTCPEEWRPLWTNLPEARESCPELLQCSSTEIGVGWLGNDPVGMMERRASLLVTNIFLPWKRMEQSGAGLYSGVHRVSGSTAFTSEEDRFISIDAKSITDYTLIWIKEREVLPTRRRLLTEVTDYLKELHCARLNGSEDSAVHQVLNEDISDVHTGDNGFFFSTRPCSPSVSEVRS
ncbi:hypothetical protein Bbelb_192360 [Branchiostoma belcheri]|nr:hypothetical protein Bbelb_192360 [Branchiostoma belcheri]